MKIAICDDNKAFIISLKSDVNRIFNKMNIDCEIDVFLNGNDLVANSNLYDVIFLDIDMPQISGIDVCNKVNINKGKNDLPFVVFVTCKENLVFDALKQYPYSFIRKSALEEELESCIHTIYKKIYRSGMYYLLREGRRNVRINLNDVLYLEKIKNYICYHTESKIYNERCNMDEKEIEFSDKGFIRCHAGYIANAKHITSVEATKVLLDNKVDIPVSRKYKSDLLSKYFDWMVKRYD